MRNLLRYIRLVAAVLLVGLPFQVLAQQDPAFAHYWELEPQFNPATAGRSDQLSLNMAYQTHATGYTNSGGTMYAGADIAVRLATAWALFFRMIRSDSSLISAFPYSMLIISRSLAA